MPICRHISILRHVLEFFLLFHMLPSPNVVHVGDAAAQTRHVLETIKGVVEAAGGTMDDVTFNHVFLADWADYAAINAVYAEYFPGEKPARYCIQSRSIRTPLSTKCSQNSNTVSVEDPLSHSN